MSAPFGHDLSDGVYVGLPELTYFEQHRIGSTDLVKLLREPANWWYSSSNNPDHEDTGSEERDFGKALHLLILEGTAAFNHAISVSPYEDFRSREARDWRDKEQAAGRTILSMDQLRRCEHMARLILNHPQYAEPLRQGLAEVSVLFQMGGLAMRARLDYLLPRFVLDLKSFGGHVRGRDLKDKALRIVAERDYDVQRYVYDIARQRMVEFINEGLVFSQPNLGVPPAQLDWLRQLAKEPDWSWVWLFYQRQDNRAGRAPAVLPIERPRFDVTFETGRAKAMTAIANYRDFTGRFGLGEPWAVVAPMWRPADHEFPSWLKDFPAANDDTLLPEEDAA